jgi:hypothetical protein
VLLVAHIALLCTLLAPCDAGAVASSGPKGLSLRTTRVDRAVPDGKVRTITG